MNNEKDTAIMLEGKERSKKGGREWGGVEVGWKIEENNSLSSQIQTRSQT